MIAWIKRTRPSLRFRPKLADIAGKPLPSRLGVREAASVAETGDASQTKRCPTPSHRSRKSWQTRIEPGSSPCLPAKKEAGFSRSGPWHGIDRGFSFPGDGIVNCKAPIRFHDTTDFAVETPAIGNVHRDVLRPSVIESRIAERQIEGAALTLINGVVKTYKFSQHPGDVDKRLAQIYSGDVASESCRQIPRRTAQT